MPPTPPATFAPRPTGYVPCPTPDELDRIDSEVFLSFTGDVRVGSLVCRANSGSRDLTQVQKNVYVALLFMRDLSFDAPLPWTNRSLYDWFSHEIRGISIRPDRAGSGYDFCCEPEGVIQLLGRTDESTIPVYLMVMVHEARHVHGGGHLCGTKDRRIADLGATGVAYYLLLWLADHWPEVTPEQREYLINAQEWVRYSGFCQECQ